MPGRLVMNGVQREFMFHKPAGWRYWLRRRWDNPAGPQGLPLLVAYPEGYVTDRLGGRRPEDPEHFQLRWPFANLWEPESPFVPRPDDLPGATHHLDDQFFILRPPPSRPTKTRRSRRGAPRCRCSTRTGGSCSAGVTAG